MKLRRLGRNISVVLLLGVFFYATSVKELHYAFSAKHHTTAHSDHCDHHIHSTDKEDDCFICKMDFVGLFHFSEGHYSFILVFLPKSTPPSQEKVYFTAEFHAHYLRGPPSLA